MKNLFQTIARVQPALPGWCHPEKAITLASLVLALRPELTVEIGIFGGSSFVPLALAHKAIERGLVVGIEPWSKVDAVQAQTEQASREWWGAQDYAKLESDFRAVLKDLGLLNCTRIVKKRSNEVESPPAIGLLHVDGAHNDEAISDVTRFASRVILGGIVVMDDKEWTGGGVKRAIQHLGDMGFKELYPLGTGAVFQRIR